MECTYYWGKGYTDLPLFLRAYSSDIGVARTETKNSIYILFSKKLQAYSLIDLGTPLMTSLIYRWNDAC